MGTYRVYLYNIMNNKNCGWQRWASCVCVCVFSLPHTLSQSIRTIFGDRCRQFSITRVCESFDVYTCNDWAVSTLVCSSHPKIEAIITCMMGFCLVSNVHSIHLSNGSVFLFIFFVDISQIIFDFQIAITIKHQSVEIKRKNQFSGWVFHINCRSRCNYNWLVLDSGGDLNVQISCSIENKVLLLQQQNMYI